jgi:MYXO-CTERM domain-containing protein
MVLLAGARDAGAYVRYQTSAGAGFSLMPTCLPVPITVYPGTYTEMTVAEVTTAVTGAAAAWSAEANPCTFIEFGVTVQSGPAPRALNDGRKNVIFRDTSWCALDASGACDLNGAFYDPTTLALTTEFVSTSTGKIVDADIEVNAFHFRFADVVAHPELADRHDLQNVLAREFGHVLGLDYACFFPASGAPRPNDNTGQPIPDCATASASVMALTMFPQDNPGDVDKRTLEPDDRAGVCAIYPAASTPCPAGAACTCPPPGVDAGTDAGGGGPDASSADAAGSDAGKTSSGGGCSCDAGGRPAPGSWAAALLLLAAALGATIRRSPRR